MSKADQLRQRTRQFALEIIRLSRKLGAADMAARVIGYQIIKSATSVGANYREAC